MRGNRARYVGAYASRIVARKAGGTSAMQLLLSRARAVPVKDARIRYVARPRARTARGGAPLEGVVWNRAARLGAIGLPLGAVSRTAAAPVRGTYRVKRSVLAPALDRAYRRTRVQFDVWARDSTYEPYVVPLSTKPRAGFAILYTPPAYEPQLLIVGQNPSNFAGSGSIEDPPNADMLSGTVPTANSYDVHDYLLGKTLRGAFVNHPA